MHMYRLNSYRNSYYCLVSSVFLYISLFLILWNCTSFPPRGLRLFLGVVFQCSSHTTTMIWSRVPEVSRSRSSFNPSFGSWPCGGTLIAWRAFIYLKISDWDDYFFDLLAWEKSVSRVSRPPLSILGGCSVFTKSFLLFPSRLEASVIFSPSNSWYDRCCFQRGFFWSRSASSWDCVFFPALVAARVWLNRDENLFLERKEWYKFFCFKKYFWWRFYSFYSALSETL